MSLHTATRIPVDDSYAIAIGKAIYAFAYYEWTIIWIVNSFESGFVNHYSRGRPLTSGHVQKKFQEAIDSNNPFSSVVTQQEWQMCCNTFSSMIIKRNALIHAHPCTDTNGAQILSYQTTVTRSLPDMKWPLAEVISQIAEFDEASCQASSLFDKIR